MCEQEPTATTASTTANRGGRPVSRAEFDKMFEQLRTWGTHADASRGAWAEAGPRQAADAARLVRSGRSAALGLPWNTVAGPDNAVPALHYMSDLGVREAPEPSTNKDFIGADFHGKAVSHLDALSHIAYRGELYDGHVSTEVVDATGASFGSVGALGHLVTRGVLIDLPHAEGVDWLEPGTAVGAEDLQRACDTLGVEPRPGDAILLRTGHFARRRKLGPWDPSTASAGLHVDAMPWIARYRPAVLGGDGDSDVRPSPTPGIHSPIHILAITALGTPLLDNLDLEDLASLAASEGRWEFFFVVAPLNIERGTGSPVNPIAVF
ncbi:cyclase family protein [Calidifontibacter sp. DB0510]|uniref:Cyclase family protein n=1 Tax=Metallococcus carri TaxID=1656884 RepID=A0A967E7K8_9MICO|nr:cyclase family protein [Metallococcus carri]NHN54242.1 cyclase family protein [Metallococcus carri]NOP36918.1 cyclase family protein [Calidifontibacter sp. DB2511S]